MTLRRQPADFAVVERLLPAALAAIRPRPGPGCVHAIYRLDKASLTTTDAVKRLARLLDVRSALIDYAGLKDKHAVTSQHVSVRIDSAARPGPLPPAQVGDAPDAVRAKRLGWCSHPITAAWIDANVFTIVVRDLAPADAEAIARRAEALREPAGVRILNLFGSQRFGSARHGQGFAAIPLVRGDFELALKLLIGTPARKDSGLRRDFVRTLAQNWGSWKLALPLLPPLPERKAVMALAAGKSFRDAFAALPAMLQQIAVDAYQSHIWNRVAQRLIEDPALESRSTEDPVHFTLRIPMPAPGVVPVEPWGAPMLEALRDDGLTLDKLTIPGLRRPAFGAHDRPLYIHARAFELDPPTPDELADATRGRVSVTLRFELPSGSYATTVMRALGE